MFTLDFWEDMFHLLCFICLKPDIYTFQNILDFTCYSCRLGYAVMVYCVAVDCKSKTTYTGRPGSLAGPRQGIRTMTGQPTAVTCKIKFFEM